MTPMHGTTINMDYNRTCIGIACLIILTVYAFVGIWSTIRPSSVLSGFSILNYERVAFSMGQIFNWSQSGTFQKSSPVIHDPYNTGMNATITHYINDTASTSEITSSVRKSTNSTMEQFSKPTWYIRSGCAGRLGNQMLQYAALFCVTRGDKRRHGYIKSDTYSQLRNTFPNLSLPTLNITMTNKTTVQSRLERLGPSEWFKSLPEGNITIGGYFTSHIYITYAENEIRKEYTFPKDIRQSVSSYFQNTTPTAWTKSTFTRIGIHVRRGDRANEGAFKAGEVMHPAAYFHHAMEYFLKRLKKVQFIVASDDIKWCKINLNRTNVVFSERNYVLDLAILASCDHMIISTGTYGWWAGYLCKGTTIYYGVYPPNGTSRAIQYANGRWIPPPRSRYNNWIALTL